MRTFLLLIVLLILIAIGLVYFGFVNIHNQGNGVTVETSDVRMGTTVQNVQVPVVRMENRQVEVPSVAVTNDQPAPANTQ
jgi:ABC-type phosphate transport system auxiliary subunit